MLSRCATSLITLAFSLTIGCSSKPPEEALLVVADSDFDRVVVKIDGVEVGTLSPMGPGPRWFNSLLERWWGKNPVLDAVVVVVDLDGISPGSHSVVVERPSHPPFAREFQYPDQLDHGVIFISLHHDEDPQLQQGTDNALTRPPKPLDTVQPASN